MDKKKRWFPWRPKKQEDQEIEALRGKIAERPDDPRLYQRLAELLLEKGQRPEAMEAFVKAAECHVEAGFHLRAIAIYRRVLRMEESPEILLKLAELYLSNGLLGDALVQYRKVIHLYKSKGKSHEILGALRRMGEVAPGSLEVRLKYIELLRNEGFLNQAFDELMKLNQAHREGSDGALWNHVEQQLREVAGELEELFVSQGRQRELASLKEKMEELTAKVELPSAAQSAPNQVLQERIQEEDIEILEIQQELEGGFQVGPKVLPGEGSEALKEVSTRLEEARIYEEQGLWEEAEEIYSELLSLDPQCLEAKEGLGRIEKGRARLGHPQGSGDLKKLEEVEAQQRKLCETKPQGGTSLQDAKAHYELGLSFRELGLLDEAISELKIASSHPQVAFASYREMGICHRAKGELNEAVNCLRKAIQCKGVSKAQLLEAGYELARTLEEQGRGEEALILYKKIQEQEQGFRDIEERVKILSQ